MAGSDNRHRNQLCRAAGTQPGLADLANFDTGSTALTLVSSNVPAGSYYVRVYAKNACGLSSSSNEVLTVVQ